MVEIIWEFFIKQEKIMIFEKIYGKDGEWARLFRNSGGYHGTRVICDSSISNRYLIIDHWDDLGAFNQFQQQFSLIYEELDSKCKEIFISEKIIGVFKEI